MKKMSLEKCRLFYNTDFTNFHRFTLTWKSKNDITNLKAKQMEEFYLKEETYKIIGLCMEVHKILGKGHSENIYADALEYEFKCNSIPYEREKK